ncbi:MAG: TetR family transcriptional regulator [Polyangiaceae bacterium]|nr:TetR family transcriptional regulator [Polyangiaceae bacterium]
MGRSSYRKSEASRQQVLDAAVVTLAARGLTEASVKDIAATAHMSKGAVHYHFENKEELYERVLEQCWNVIEKRGFAAFDEPGSALDRIHRAILEMWAMRRDAVPEVRVVDEFYVMSRQNPAIRGALAEHMRRTRQHIVNIGFSRLIELGLKPKVSMHFAARLLLATLDGLSIHHSVDPLTPEEEGEVLRTLDAILLAIFEI